MRHECDVQLAMLFNRLELRLFEQRLLSAGISDAKESATVFSEHLSNSTCDGRQSRAMQLNIIGAGLLAIRFSAEPFKRNVFSSILRQRGNFLQDYAISSSPTDR
jgi:hypothetical protein